MANHAQNVHISRNMILAQDIRLSMNTRQTRRNLNVLVIGGAGSGKSRFFVKPNLCEMPLNTSFVITDPSGELIIETGHMLEAHGYKIKVFNLVNMKQTYHYNPLHYINEENDIILLVDCILQNTTDPNKTGGDDFWEKAQALMLRAFTALIWMHGENLRLPNSLTTFLDLMRGCQVSEEDSTRRQSSNDMCKTDMLFEAVKTQGWYFDDNDQFHLGKPSNEEFKYYEPTGEDLATKYYDGFKQGAGKTLKSILISAIARLSTLESDDVQNLFAQDDIELDKLGDEKTALFIIIPQEHDSFNFIAAMMYTQLFQALYYHAENECKGNYLVCDAAGEVTKIFPIPHVHEEFHDVDYTKAQKVDLSRKGKVSLTSQETVEKASFIHKILGKKKPQDVSVQTQEQAEEEPEVVKGVDSGPIVDDPTTRPDDDPGDPNEQSEAAANEYVKIVKDQIQAFEIEGLYILKIPDKDGKCDSQNGEIIGIYSDPEQARQKILRMKNCTVKRCGLYLPYHVTFMLDEFANIGQIPSFNKKLATMRKYEISCCIIVQALSQIKNMYKDDNETLIGNCDTMLFLGSSAVDTLEYISKKLGKTTIDVRNHSASKGSHGSHSLSYNKTGRELKTPDELAMMPESDCIVMIRGVYPYYGKKHQFVNHRNYKYTADASSDNNYIIRPPKIKQNKQKISFGDMPMDKAAQFMQANNIDTEDLTETTKERYISWREHRNIIKQEANKEKAQEQAAKNKARMQQNGIIDPNALVQGEEADVVEKLNQLNAEAQNDPTESPLLTNMTMFPPSSSLEGMLETDPAYFSDIAEDLQAEQEIYDKLKEKNQNDPTQSLTSSQAQRNNTYNDFLNEELTDTEPNIDEEMDSSSHSTTDLNNISFTSPINSSDEDF